MDTASLTHLQNALTEAAPGRPVTAAWLAARGVSNSTQKESLAAGCLDALAPDVFIQHGSQLDMKLALGLGVTDAHVGGKAALDWHGYRKYCYFGGMTVRLYSHGTPHVAPWLYEHFRVKVRTAPLFTSGDSLGVNLTPEGVYASEPERAVLEMLSEFPEYRGGTEEVEFIVDMLNYLRPDLMRRLLDDCTRSDTVDMFMSMARKFHLPVLADPLLLDPDWAANQPDVFEDVL